MAAQQHTGCLILHRGVRGGACMVRDSGDLQYGSGSQFNLGGFIEMLSSRNVRISMDGKAGAGQCVHRAALEEREI